MSSSDDNSTIYESSEYEDSNSSPVSNSSEESSNLINSSQEEDTQEDSQVDDSKQENDIITGNEINAVKEEDDILLELGDRIIIDSTRYGRITGRIYYRDDELIRILPDGISDRLYDFELIDNDFDEDVKDIALLEKRITDSFVTQHNLRAGQILTTYTSAGEQSQQYEIIRVNDTLDRIRIRDATGTESVISFSFIGIPRDLPFVIVRGTESHAAVSTATVNDDAAATATVQPPPVAEMTAEDEPTEEEITASINLHHNAASSEEIEEEVELPIIGFIDIPVLLEMTEIPKSQRLFPEEMQKADALNDLLQTLDAAQQKNPTAIKRIRILTELLSYLKNEVIHYDENNMPRLRATSVDTLRDMLHSVHVPLGRPVLDIKKRVYYAPTEKKEKKRWGKKKKTINEPEPNEEDRQDEAKQMEDDELHKLTEEQSQYLYQIPFATELENFLNANQTQSTGSTGYNINFWIWLPSVLSRFARTWVPTETDTIKEKWSAIADTEFFRSELPADDEENATLAGIIPSGNPDTQPFIGSIKYGYERALSSTFRADEKKRKRLLIESESAPLKSYLLFPLKTEAKIGSTRTGSLAKDIESAQAEPKWMSRILKENKIEETPTSTGILALGSTGNTIGNISLADYFNALQLPTTSMNGIADLVAALYPFGIEHMELSADLFKILQKKIQEYNASLKTYIQGLRDELVAISKTERTLPAGILSAEAAAAQDGALQSEPILQETLSELRRQSPNIATMDLAKLVHLLNIYPDLTIATLGAVPAIQNRARLRAARDEFIEALHIAKRLQIAEMEKGVEPTENPCEHAAMLKDIRRITDDNERMQFLVKYLNKYQGERVDNWINCSRCNQHLLCLHEFNILQQFLKPREKQVLQKELILQFAGPLFSGKYTCRNCGQPFAEMKYDTNLEFDDEGNPLMGRAVLVDDDAIKEEALDNALGPQIGSDDNPIEETLGDLLKHPKQKSIYFIAKQISNRVGIFLDVDSYKKVIKRANKYIKTLDTREEYKKKAKESGRDAMDYDVYLARITVCITAVYLLIQIQTRIPNFTVRYTLRGCNPPGFDGYPLGKEDNKTGINYIACAISSIQRNEPPWNSTGFLAERQDAVRQKRIMQYIEALLKKVINDPDIQIDITKKRHYLETTFGSEYAEGGALSEIIPTRFLPIPYKRTPESNAAEPLVDGATPAIQAQLWIQTGNEQAEKTATILQGSPFADSTCCKSDITQPGAFWEKDMPQLGERRMQPAVARGGSRLAPQFTPRPMAQLLADAPESIYYRVFLKVCFRGPRIGHPHELGMNLKCPWCDFVFPFHPMLQQTASKDEKAEMDKQLEMALESQGIDITPTSFQELLDATHNVNLLPVYNAPAFEDTANIFNKLSSLNPVPMSDEEEWKTLVESIRGEFSDLEVNASNTDVALASKDIVELIKQYESQFLKRMKEKMFAIYLKIVSLSFENYAEVILTYFIQPIARLLNNFNSDSLVFIQPEYKLAQQHVDVLQNNVLKPEVNIMTVYSEHINSEDATFIRAKLQQCKQQLIAVKKMTSDILTIPYGPYSVLQTYIKRLLLIAPLTEMLNGNIIPAFATESDSVPVRILNDLLADCLKKYNKERLGYSMEDIKEDLMVRSEKEKNEFIKFFDRMSDDEKAAEKMKKMLGIGRWAVGGTAAIRIYDADRWDAERAERAAAGIMDFAAQPDGDIGPSDGRDYDDMGIMNYGAGGEDGYDNVQIKEDDY